MTEHRVSVAVLPFRNLTRDPDHDYFVHGLLEDLVTELSRFRSIDVVAAQSSLAALGDEEQLPDALGARLHADFLLQGSIRRSGGELRINAQLIESKTSRNLWARRFEAPVNDLFSIEEEIVASVASALAIGIETDRLGRARRQPLANLEAYDCWLRGMDRLRKGTLETDLEARACFGRSLELDPHFAPGHAGMSLSYFNEWSCQAWHLWEENECGAYQHAVKAAELDDGDALIQIVLGRIHLYRRQFDQAERLVDRALLLNPNHTDVLVHAALAKFFLGDPEEALTLGLKAIRLHPLHDPWFLAVPGLSLFGLRSYEEALSYLTRAGDPTVDLPAVRAAAAAYAGQKDRALIERDTYLLSFRTRIAFGREPEPGEPLAWVVQVNPFRNKEDGFHFAEGLRRAGLDEAPSHSPVLTTATHIRPAELPLEGNAFRREGDLWTVAFGGAGAKLAGLKGFDDLAMLLAQPGKSVHCLELFGLPLEESKSGAVLDRQARENYHQHIRELQIELDDAESRNDRGRAERARAELDALVEELSNALGLGGKPRRLKDPAERARSAVTWRIRSAIKKIHAAHPRLGQHLNNSVRTGTFCCYSPETGVEWEL